MWKVCNLDVTGNSEQMNSRKENYILTNWIARRNDKIYVVGAGGHGKVAVRAAQLSGVEVQAIFDDDPKQVGQSLLGVPVVGRICELSSHQSLPTLIAIGDNQRRLAVARAIKNLPVSIVHPTAIIDDEARIGAGVLVLAGSIVQVGSIVGDHSIINDGAIVDHDCQVGIGAHVSCGVCLAGGAKIGCNAMIGVNASVLPGVAVGDFSTVGAGAVLLRDLPSYRTAVGVPARILPESRLPLAAC